MTSEVILVTEISCPHCAYKKTETMPTEACLWFYQCEGCGELLKPKSGDCCVFCSYATVPCPPVQSGVDACCSSAHNPKKIS